MKQKVFRRFERFTTTRYVVTAITHHTGMCIPGIHDILLVTLFQRFITPRTDIRLEDLFGHRFLPRTYFYIFFSCVDTEWMPGDLLATGVVI